MKIRRRRQDSGFTLVELLIVIVILGILATVTVFAVTGITNKGKSSACATDHDTLVTAEEAYNAEHGTYGTLSELKSAGRIHDASTLFTVTLTTTADHFSLDGVGSCVGFVPANGVGGPTPTTTLPVTPGSAINVADAITYGGMSAMSYAAPGATATVVIIGNGSSGSGSGNALLDFNDVVHGAPAHPGVNLVFVDITDAVNSSQIPDVATGVDAIIAMHPALIANYYSGDSGNTSSALIARNQFFLGASYNITNGIESVLAFYDDYIAGGLGGTPTTYGGMPALRIGPATATHEALIIANGAFATTAHQAFTSLTTTLPADTSVLMLATSQGNYPALFDSYFDGLLSEAPQWIFADPAFQIQHGSSSTDIDQYVSTHPPYTNHFVGLTADISSVTSALT